MSAPLVRLDEVAVIDRFSVDPTSLEDDAYYVGLEHIESGGRLSDVTTVSSGALASTKFRFSPQHILYGKLRPYLAKIAAPDFDGICSTDILPILPGPRLVRGYLLHYLRQPSMVAYASSRAEGANLPRLSPKALAKFEIPLPPLNEQRRIAAILDKADDLRQKRKKAIALLDSLTQSIFLKMFGGLIVEMQKSGHTRPLCELADIGSGITKGRNVTGREVVSVPYLAVANVQDKRLSLAAVKHIEATSAEIQRCKLRRDDLLLTEGGDPDKLGRGALWQEELPLAIHQNHVFRVRFASPEIEPLFANWLIGGQYGKSYFLRMAKQTTGIASINKTQLAAFPMIVPPLQLQRQFAERAQVIAKQLRQLGCAEDALEAAFSSLQSLAFQGGI